MKLLNKCLIALALALIAIVPFGNVKNEALAQQVLGNMSPVYTPSVAFPFTPFSATVSAPTATAAFSVQNQATAIFEFAGTFTGLSAVVQVTDAAPSITSPTWKTVDVSSYTEGALITNISAAGLYAVPLAGARQIRVLVNAVTIASPNTLAITMSGNTGVRYIRTSKERLRTFSAAAEVVPTAAGDFFTIAGNATNKIRIKEIACTGTSATAALEIVSLIKRSTIGTGAATATLTDVPINSTNIAGTAVVKTYNTVPSPVGTAVGTLRTFKVYLPATASATTVPSFSWKFGDDEDQQLSLNSATENVAINTTTGSYTQTWDCFVTWTER